MVRKAERPACVMRMICARRRLCDCDRTAGRDDIVMTAWVIAAQPLAGEGMELQSIAAVVVGGVALAGGSGNMLQAFYGVLVLGWLSNALNMAGVSSFLQVLVVGVVILLAVVVDRLRTRTAT